MQRHLISREIVDRAALDRIEDEVKEELRVAWDEAQKEPAPDPSFYFAQVHRDTSPRLRRDLERFDRNRRG